MGRKVLSVVAVMVFSVMFLVFSADAKIIVKYGHVGPPVHPQHHGAVAFAKYVTEKTNGAIEVQVFPLGQLGGERSMCEQVQGGTLHMTTASASVLSNFVPEVGIIELPFIYPDRESAYKTLDDRDVRERLAKYCDAKGYVFIGYTENEFRDLTNSKRPVKSPADMAGLKIRVMESPVMIDTFKALGANPTPLPFPEIYNALQQKVIDGQDNPISTSIMMKFTEVNKFATLTGHILTECLTIVGKDFWKSLTPEQQKIFREAAAVQIKVNRDNNAQSRIAALEKAKAQNVDVHNLSAAERAAFKKAVQPVLDKYRAQYGAEWYDFFTKKVASYAK